MSRCSFAIISARQSLCSLPRRTSTAAVGLHVSRLHSLSLTQRHESTSLDATTRKSIVPIYHEIEAVENIEEYRPDGFHPVSIGDRLGSGRYYIVDKLGHGGYSTTWLALDVATSQYVAVKICSADSGMRITESQILRRLNGGTGDPEPQPGSQLIRSILDTLELTGPNGRHLCLVSAVAQMSVHDALEASVWNLFKPRTARAIVAQVVQAVGFLHSQGVVHGDLHHGNVLIQLPSGINDLSIDALYQKFGAPQPQPVVRRDGKPLEIGVPRHVFPPIWLGKPSHELDVEDASILLSDFGESFMPVSTSRSYSHTPLLYRAPEVRFRKTQDFPSDIWSLACLVWRVLGQRPMFDEWFTDGDEILAEQVDLLGKLPEKWWMAWEGRSGYFVDDGDANVKFLPKKKDMEGWSWDRRFDLCIHTARKRESLEAMMRRGSS